MEKSSKIYYPHRLLSAWKQVKRKNGTSGVGRMTIRGFEGRKSELLGIISEKLKAGTYHFKPARRALKPKGNSPEMRKLNIPTVMDRVVARYIHSVLAEIFDIDFTKSNFGFRKGKSQHQAIRYLRDKMMEGYSWCVKIDLRSFFNELSHNLILKLIRRKVTDKQLLTLITRALKAGVVTDEGFRETPC